MIVIEGVTHRHGATAVLREVSLTVPDGHITALIGPNGAGKSTLLSLMCRLEALQWGTITVDGLRVDRTPPRTLARHVAVMRQDGGPATRFRVRELVAFGRFPHHRGRPSPSDRAAVEDALELFDLGALAERFVETLSGGERQRARAAMAFCQGTSHLLLDEPLNNLDIVHARALMRTLRRAVDERGRTIVLVLHDLNHAAAHADRVVAMGDGRIVAAGVTAEIITPAVLEQVFGFPIAVETVAGRPVALPFL